MPRRSTLILPLVLASAVCAAAETATQTGFDVLALPAAFPGMQGDADATVVSSVRSRLRSDMSVALRGRLVIAARDTSETGPRIAGYEARIRSRLFPNLEARRTLVVLAEDTAMLRRLAEALYPSTVDLTVPPFGFYHPEDRLILTTTTDGDAAFLHWLMRALVQEDNPDAPDWFLEAMATLYDRHDGKANRLKPVLDDRMALIAPSEDLDYDIFAGICDCSALTDEQYALIRLLLVYLDERGQLSALNAAVREQGRYTTLLQALEAMDFDARAWKSFAQRRVRTWWKSHGEAS